MSPGDPKEPSELTESASQAGADGESTLVAQDEGGKARGAASPAGLEQHIPAVGTKIGKYELQEKLGSGGMSVVYKARDLALDRYVALKLLLPKMGVEQIDTMRFQQEAKAASRLEHPNIVKVHDFNVTEDGVPYLVMSYLSGISLSDAIKQEGGLSPGRWISIMVQACDALSCAHENNVVHRDIKPSNFVLCEEKGNEVLKLVDFGIAKIETNDEQALTKTGEVFGSPLYMSPEQCSGSKVDLRSDVYSLGCVMYEALAGKPPLVGDNSLATIVKHLQETPASIASVCPKLPGIESIDKIVMKCLEKKPEDRYPDMLSVRKDLESLFLGRKLKGKADRRMIVVTILAAVLCAGFLGYKYYSDYEQKEQARLAIVLKQKQDAEARMLFLTGRKHRNAGELSAWKNDTLKALELATAAQSQQVFQAALNLEYASCELKLQNHSVARPYLEKVALWPLSPADPYANQLKYSALNILGFETEITLHNPKAAIPLYENALKYAQLLGRAREQVSSNLNLSHLSQLVGRADDADKYLKQALAIGKDNDEDVANTLEVFCKVNKDYDNSKELLARADLIRKNKARQVIEKHQKKAKEDAIERESDRKADMKTEELKREWGKAILP